MKFLKNYFWLLFFLMVIFSCSKEKSSKIFYSADESIKSTLVNFPMMDKKFNKEKEVDLDSLSISIYKNPQKTDYDEMLVFRKNKQYYAIPFFSNMYFDYWKFENATQKQLYPKTNSNFETQLKIMIGELNLTPDEFSLVFDELMKGVLATETNLYLKSKLFENYIYLTYRVDKYKIDDDDSCRSRNKKLFDKIMLESEKTIQYNRYYLDAENGRVYELINDGRKKGEFKFKVKTYRIDCFSYPLNI